MKRIQVGLYGANGHQIHNQLEANPRAVCRGFSGYARERLSECLRNNRDLREYGSLADMAADPALDLISLCSPRRDTQWRAFCEAFALKELGANTGFASNNGRVARRDVIKPAIADLFRSFSKADLMDKLERIGLPFAPISKPHEMLDDPHLNAAGGLLPLTLPDGERQGTAMKLPALPLEMQGGRFGVTRDIPRQGQHTREVLAGLGYSEAQIGAMLAAGAAAEA
jgi:crotonobetainyl-CoA:carnitine CoA-transferase CaiB-like acyl-CoA transferase